jgi:hypothetical protein
MSGQEQQVTVQRTVSEVCTSPQPVGVALKNDGIPTPRLLAQLSPNDDRRITATVRWPVELGPPAHQ